MSPSSSVCLLGCVAWVNRISVLIPVRAVPTKMFLATARTVSRTRQSSSHIVHPHELSLPGGSPLLIRGRDESFQSLPLFAASSEECSDAHSEAHSSEIAEEFCSCRCCFSDTSSRPSSRLGGLEDHHEELNHHEDEERKRYRTDPEASRSAPPSTAPNRIYSFPDPFYVKMSERGQTVLEGGL